MGPWLGPPTVTSVARISARTMVTSGNDDGQQDVVPESRHEDVVIEQVHVVLEADEVISGLNPDQSVSE